MNDVAEVVISRVRHAFRRRGQVQIRLLRLSGAKLGPRVTFNAPVFVIGPAQNLTVGAGTVINELVVVNCRGRVRIGSDCHVSSGSQILSTRLSVDGSAHVDDAVVIGDRVWIAAGAVIGPGVTIADDCVVGANSVVLRDLQIAGLYAGTPATLVRSRGVNDEGRDPSYPLSPPEGRPPSGG